ncbi:hypothetical protein GGR51DRAFT_175375 [Nemania sp. FL0031]|nr:hypothetical protein GGR51DRAFT_175375 [Nemania sp. FL0031]
MDTIQSSTPNWPSPVSTFRPTPWRRACVACTRAKRQCSKQVPKCRRCLEKGLQCTYLPPRRPEITGITPGITETSLPLSSSTTGPLFDEGLVSASSGLIVPFDFNAEEESALGFLSMTETNPETLALPTEAGPSGGPPQAVVSSDALVSLRGAWFLAPESWIAEFTEPPPTTIRETERSLKQYIEQVQLWMRQWVTEGHSPLHHPELYSFYMPRHVQDAYTAVAAYLGKTRENESMVHRILEDRVAQLLQDQAVDEASLGNASGGDDDSPSIFDRLSRVQSLLCYQLIRLFDGDIRMRGQAEALVPTLYLWNRQMLESVKDSLGRPERLLAGSPYHRNLPLGASASAPSTAESPKAIWRAWIVAESVRRTWQAANVVQEVYQFFKRGWSECPGRLPNTMQQALWGAPSAYSWIRELKGGRDPLLVSIVELEEMIPQLALSELDDFSIAAIGLYGMEKVDHWLEEKRRDKSQIMPGLDALLQSGSAG